MSVTASHAYVPRTGRAYRIRPIGLAGPGSVATAGLATFLLGAWAGIVVFVGPVFGYTVTSGSAWTWTMDNWMLHLAPGALAFLAGLMIMAGSPSGRRGGVSLGALAAALAGAWLVIGPAAWPWYEHGPAYGFSSGAGPAFIYQIGANLGPGVLLAILAGICFKAAHPGPIAAGTGPVATSATPAPVATTVPAGAPVTAVPVQPAPATAPVQPAPVAAPVEQAPVVAPVQPAPATVAGPTVADPTVADPTVADPTVADPTVADPTVADPTVADPSVNRMEAF